MKCSNPHCKDKDREFEEKDIQLSHDVPRYVGGKDIDGRHYLCKRCHDIYERLVFAVMVSNIHENIKIGMRQAAQSFAKRFFRS